MSVERRAEVWQEILALGGRDETNWVAEVDGEVVGFAGAGASRDDGAAMSTGEIFAIYVSPEHWSTGAGPALMDQATGWLRDRFDRATLWVLDSNVRARSFYEKAGWDPDGAEKDDDRGNFVLREVRYRITL